MTTVIVPAQTLTFSADGVTVNVPVGPVEVVTEGPADVAEPEPAPAPEPAASDAYFDVGARRAFLKTTSDAGLLALMTERATPNTPPAPQTCQAPPRPSQA